MSTKKNKKNETAKMQCESALKQEEERKEKFDKKPVDLHYTGAKKKTTQERAERTLKDLKDCLERLEKKECERIKAVV
jgi:hypothetical protein